MFFTTSWNKQNIQDKIRDEITEIIWKITKYATTKLSAKKKQQASRQKSKQAAAATTKQEKRGRAKQAGQRGKLTDAAAAAAAATLFPPTPQQQRASRCNSRCCSSRCCCSCCCCCWYFCSCHLLLLLLLPLLLPPLLPPSLAAAADAWGFRLTPNHSSLPQNICMCFWFAVQAICYYTWNIILHLRSEIILRYPIMFYIIFIIAVNVLKQCDCCWLEPKTEPR